MTELIGTVTSIEEEETSTGTPFWNVELKGKKYATFKQENIDGLEEGMHIQADVGVQKKGKYTNYYFNTWEEVESVASKPSPRRDTQREPREVPPQEYRKQEADSERARSMALSYAKDLALSLKLEGDDAKLSEAVVMVARRFTKYILTGE